MNEKQKHSSCESFCESEPFTRENYYFGKLLTAQALQSEQRYLNEKRWLINRYGIGWGVLCGLKVEPDCKNPCGIIVQPGLALDKYGNEILICKPKSIDLKSVCMAEKASNNVGSEAKTRELFIILRYEELEANPSPVPIEHCGKLEDKCYYNKTVETFKIYCTSVKPEIPKTIREEFVDALKCEKDGTQFWDNPASLIIEGCQSRLKGGEIILASISYTERTPIQDHHIDNITYRKLVFSNETLYAMIHCMSEESRQTKGDLQCLSEENRQAKGDRHDRRQHVPLLANTIKGLSYRDGKIAKIDGDAGKHPFRITSDGDVIWITDLESPKLHRIDRKNNKLVEDKLIDLSCCDKSINSSWGIAFDGKYMWITHNNAGEGKLTRINICKLDDCWTFNALPDCTDLEDCEKYCFERTGTTNVVPIPAYPQEVVYHHNLLYVSHGWDPETVQTESQDKQGTNEEYPRKTATLLISIIDTDRCCLIKTISVINSDCASVSPITSMVSDGEALWIAYTAGSLHDKESRSQPVVQKIKYDLSKNEFEIGEQYIVDKGQSSGKLAFDGTHLWVTHNEGASKIELSTGNIVSHIETDQPQVAIAYGGGDNIWTAEYGDMGNEKSEGRLNRMDIHSADHNGEIEFASDIPGYIITDAQFDGVFIYVSAYSSPEKDKYAGNQGVIHRILP